MKTNKILMEAYDNEGRLIMYVQQVNNHLIKYFEGESEIKEIPVVNGVPTIGG